MKKILLVIFCAPLMLFAQSGAKKNINVITVSPETDKAHIMYPKVNTETTVPSSPVRVGTTAIPRRKVDEIRGYDLHADTIGMTYYDLQTNNAVPRRVVLHDDGTISAVWTNSNEKESKFLDRGTGYNYFDGVSWIGTNTSRFEPDRAGWPNIADYDSAGITKEIIVSHLASASGSPTGGTFWMVNDQVGTNDFDLLRKVDMPDGPYWPRISSASGYVHMVGVYNSTEPNLIVKNGVRNPIVYYRYNVTTGQMEVNAEPLPGYDSTRYLEGGTDIYDIDAQDSTVAILISGMVNDLALWKSTDYGKNWTKTIIDSFPHKYVDTLGFPFDTTFTNDRKATLVLDQTGIAHVFFPNMRVLKRESDTTYVYFPGTNGILYWNDKDQAAPALVGQTPDLDGTGFLELAAATTDWDNGAGYISALSTMPSAAVDANDNIYMVFSAPNELDVVDIIGPGGAVPVNARDIFVVFSNDHGKTWSQQQNLTNGVLDYNLVNYSQEDVYASLARRADSNLHMVWMRDNQPGVFLVNGFAINENYMMYASVPIADIQDQIIDSTWIGINEPVNHTIRGLYPNPADNNVTVALNLKSGSSAVIRIVDVLGKTVTNEDYRNLQAGNNMITMDVSTLKPGVYILQVNSGGHSSSSRLVVE